MASTTMEEIKASMRSSTVKINTFLAVPVTWTFLPSKSVKLLEEHWTWAFAFLISTTGKATMYDIFIWIGVKPCHPIKTQKMLAININVWHSLTLLWFADLMNVTEEVTIHRPNVSTLLSSAFIRGGHLIVHLVAVWTLIYFKHKCLLASRSTMYFLIFFIF